MRTRIKAALVGNLKRGEGQREFTKTVDAEFDRAGCSRLKSHQIANIYETNTATAFSAGQMARMIEVQEDFPFWRFSAIMDSHTSPEHAALHGKIFRNGDFTFFPPLRHRCRCTALLLTARQAGKYPKSDMPGADQRAELYSKAGNPEFAGHKQANYLTWLESEYKDADPATRRLIDQATEAMRQELKSMGKAIPKPAAQNIPEKAENSPIPEVLAEGGEFVKGTKIVYNKAFFALLDKDKPVGLAVATKGGAYYSPSERKVYLVNGDRVRTSVWHRERIVYHEFGHAIDSQRNLRGNGRITSMLKEWQKTLGKKSTYMVEKLYQGEDGRLHVGPRPEEMPKIAYISKRLGNLQSRINRMDAATFSRRGITKEDVLEQITATQDTIMAINPNYGRGHTKAYFKQPGMREAEFIAHCFENKFSGNQIFKKYLPDLYQATIDYINELQ